MLLCVIGVRIRRKAIFARKTPYRLCQIGVELLLLVWPSQLTPLLIAFNVYVRDERKSKCIILASNSECFFYRTIVSNTKVFSETLLKKCAGFLYSNICIHARCSSPVQFKQMHAAMQIIYHTCSI